MARFFDDGTDLEWLRDVAKEAKEAASREPKLKTAKVIDAVAIILCGKKLAAGARKLAGWEGTEMMQAAAFMCFGLCSAGASARTAADPYQRARS